jgi:hypothetical protein
MSIDRMRNQAAKIALEQDAEYLLFIDDDVLVPIDALRKLIDCNADIAGGKAVIRGYPFDWMVFKDLGEGKGLEAYKELPNDGIMDCDVIGFCCTLIKTSVFRNMPTPYFVTGVNWTEDVWFCKKAKLANPDLTVKVDCSVNLGHILWPEVMEASNRAEYKAMMERLEPNLTKNLRGLNDPPLRRKDRTQDYLDAIEKEILDAKT